MFKKKEHKDDQSEEEAKGKSSTKEEEPIEPDEILGAAETRSEITEKAAYLTGGAVLGNIIKMAFKDKPLVASIGSAVVEGLTYVGVKRSTNEPNDMPKIVQESSNQMSQVQKMLEGIQKDKKT